MTVTFKTVFLKTELLKRAMLKALLSIMFAMSFVNMAQANWDEAAGEVNHSIEEMLQQVIPYRGKEQVDLEPLYENLDKILTENVDFKYISKVVMGKYFRRASEQNISDFETVFKRTLIKTYGKTLVSFNIASYKIVPPAAQSPKPNKQKVIVDVESTTGQRYSIVNYMVKKDGKWQLVNAVLDGFNLRVTFKNQFSNLASKNKNNVSAAIEKWADTMDKKDK